MFGNITEFKKTSITITFFIVIISVITSLPRYLISSFDYI